MRLEKDDECQVLIPVTSPAKCWKSFVQNQTKCYLGDYTIGKDNKFHVFYGRILTNPKREAVQDGLSCIDMKHGFGVGNFGCVIRFSIDDNQDDTVLITWTDVLCGGKNGMQVWSKRQSFVNLSNCSCYFLISYYTLYPPM